jgi:hypothetical protein
MSLAFVQSEWTFYAIRFLLGVFDAGAEAVDRLAELEIRQHLQLGEAHVHPVDPGQDRKTLARITILWGLASMSLAFVQSEWTFYAIRFLLEVADEEDAGAEAVDRLAELEIRQHLQLGEAHVHPPVGARLDEPRLRAVGMDVLRHPLPARRVRGRVLPGTSNRK